jgi:ubiquitin thioesterase protein OTUB1
MDPRETTTLTLATAIAFAYLEALLSVGDVTKFELEEVRFKSMQNLHNTAGHPQDIIEDFADAVFDLLKALANAVSKMDGSGPGILHQSFNDYSISMGIITYFKVYPPASAL